MAKTKVTRVKKTDGSQKRKFNFGAIFYFIRTLWSNGVVFEIGKTTKWFWSIILFVVSTIITVIPTMSTQFNTKVESLLTNGTQDNLYRGLYEYAKDDTAGEITFDSNFNLAASNVSSGEYDYKLNTADSPAALKPTFSAYDKSTGANYLDIYVFNDKKYEEDANWKVLSEKLQATNSTYGDSDESKRKVILEAGQEYTRQASLVVFLPTKLFIRAYNLNGKNYRDISGDYKHVFEKFDASKESTFKAVLLKDNDSTKLTSVQMDKVSKNFLLYLNLVYVNPRISSAWVTTSIIGSINAGIMLIMGILMWAFTRGKKSVNRDLTIFNCYSMAFWLSLTPAILSMIMSFIMPQFSMMFFVLIYAMRSMFMTTRYVRPMQAA